MTLTRSFLFATVKKKGVICMPKYSKTAQKSVERAMKKMEEGKLVSGKSGQLVTDPRQAVAIGLSEARKKGAKMPRMKK